MQIMQSDSECKEHEYVYTNIHKDNLYKYICNKCEKEIFLEIANENVKNQIRFESNERNDEDLRFINGLRIRLYCLAKKKKVTFPIEDYLGCSIDTFREKLESKFTNGMNWDNYGDWQIDHIRPCASFNVSDDNELKKCFNYTNLQPLWKSENSSKGSKWEGKRWKYEDKKKN